MAAGSSVSAAGTPTGPDAPLEFRDIAIVGGGCYGTFYAGQLLRARERGKVTFRRLLIVDHDAECQAVRELAPAHWTHRVQDWTRFFDDWLGGEAGAGDAIVPSPLMPHLMYEWIVRRARARWPGRAVRTIPVDAEARTPYDMLAPDGIRYVSHADWLCPTHCIEPARCPATRAPRTWEMSDTLGELSRRMSRSATMAGPAVLRCRHRAFGVGMFDADEVLAADALVAVAGNRGDPVRILVGTVSSCHGAIGLLELGEMVAGSSILQGGPEPAGRPGTDSTRPGGNKE